MGGGRGLAFESWRLRIRDRDGAVLGAGVLLGDRTVLTCAHVLPPDHEVVVDFVGQRDVPSALARVVPGCLVPPGDDQRGDVALLRLDHPVDAAFGTSLRRAALSWNRPVRTLGFPQGLEYGVWTKLVLAAGVGPGWEWVQMNLVAGEPPVRPGFSGAGVSDEETGEVLGIVASVNRRESSGLSWMLPVEIILSYLPDLEEFATGSRAVDPGFHAVHADNLIHAGKRHTQPKRPKRSRATVAIRVMSSSTA
ncbi:serine protease [Actinosynnema sp. NPDC023794]